MASEVFKTSEASTFGGLKRITPQRPCLTLVLLYTPMSWDFEDEIPAL
jgi:hypothetical protein